MIYAAPSQHHPDALSVDLRRPPGGTPHREHAWNATPRSACADGATSECAPPSERHGLDEASSRSPSSETRVRARVTHRPDASGRRASWRVQRLDGGRTLVATFVGRFDGATGAESAAELATELALAPAHVIWDLTAMTGYETAARVAWQEALLPVRRHILGIEVVGGDPMVRVGAVTLTMALGVEASFVQTAQYG